MKTKIRKEAPLLQSCSGKSPRKGLVHAGQTPKRKERKNEKGKKGKSSQVNPTGQREEAPGGSIHLDPTTV